MDVRCVELGPAQEVKPQGIASNDVRAGEQAEAFISPTGSDHLEIISGRSLGVSLVNRAIFYLIALLLVLTAIAKLWMLITDSFAEVRVGIAKEILWISVGFELWLAFENFRIRDSRVLAFINTFVFASFACFAIVRLAMGHASCGCTGNLELPAWIFILVDLGIVTWFVATSPSQVVYGLGKLVICWSTWTEEKRGRLIGVAIFVVIIGGLQLPLAASLRTMIFDEPPIRAIVRIDNDLIFNQETSGHVEIINRSTKPAKVIGISRSCRCFDLIHDPVSKIIPSDDRILVPLVIKPNKLGPLHQRVVLFLDHPIQFRVNVDVFGSVKGVE